MAARAASLPLIGAANLANGVVGVGVGGNAGVGFILGVNVSGSVQIVASPHGQVGLAISYGGNPGYGVFGAGAVGGGQLTSSSAQNLGDFGGPAYGAGASTQLAEGTGAGIDVTTNGVNTATTVTVGGAVGTKGAGGYITNTSIPFAMNCSGNTANNP